MKSKEGQSRVERDRKVHPPAADANSNFHQEVKNTECSKGLLCPTVHKPKDGDSQDPLVERFHQGLKVTSRMGEGKPSAVTSLQIAPGRV